MCTETRELSIFVHAISGDGMGKGKRPQRKVDLPKDWWRRLNDLYQRKRQQDPTLPDIHDFAVISRRSFATARATHQMTEQLFAKLAWKFGRDQDDFLHVLGAEKSATRLMTPIPKTIPLITQRMNPQWASYADYTVTVARPWELACRITTESPYFRFGFKLLGTEGRVFGEGTIQSFDENLVVHIGRNNFPHLRMVAGDVFLTTYLNGISSKDDRLLVSSKARLEMPIKLVLDRSYLATFVVNGQAVFKQVVSPGISRRVIVLAWGDRYEYQVQVTDLAIRSI
jgi:hypothetical protein